MSRVDTKQLKWLEGTEAEPQAVDIAELSSHADRTLLWGYDLDRNSWHVYVQKGKLHLYVYNGEGETVRYASGISLPVEGLTPNKRLYPEACDFEFCKLVRAKGGYLCFTTFDADRPYKQFHGEVYKGEPAKPKKAKARRAGA